MSRNYVEGELECGMARTLFTIWSSELITFDCVLVLVLKLSNYEMYLFVKINSSQIYFLLSKFFFYVIID